MMLCFLSLYFQHSDKHKKSKVIKKQERVSTKVSLNYDPRLFNYKVIISEHKRIFKLSTVNFQG